MGFRPEGLLGCRAFGFWGCRLIIGVVGYWGFGVLLAGVLRIVGGVALIFDEAG